MNTKERSKIGKRSRRSGHGFERLLCQKLKPYFPDVMTARAGDRSSDNKGIDLLHTDCFSFQAKSSINFPNPATVLKEMPQETNLNVLAVKLKNKGIYFVLDEEDFFEIIAMMKSNQII